MTFISSLLNAENGAVPGLAAKDVSATIKARLHAGKDYIHAARTVVAPVLDCKVGKVDGALPRGELTPRVSELAERYGIKASVRRVVDALPR